MFSALTNKANEVLRKAFGDEEIFVDWTVPRECGRGDVATSVALQLASKLKKQPREVAALLRGALASSPEVEKIEIAGAGYVNVWLTPAALLRELSATREACVPAMKRENERPVIVEYSQPNIAKPLGVHHIMSTVIGQSLSNLYRHLGYNTISVNHLGDWGTQFGKLAVAVRRWGQRKSVEDFGLDGLLALYVRFHAEAELHPELEAEGRAAFKQLEDGDVSMRAFWKEVVSVTTRSLDGIYARLHVTFDEVHGESFYEDKMRPILDEGKEKGTFANGEAGALVVEFPEESGLPVFMVLKGDGATLYSTRDLAQIRYRIDRWHPQSLMYVVDVAQQLYFKQLFATVRMLGWGLPRLEHVVFGRMRFVGKKMSTREGTVLRLEHVLDEAAERARKIIAEHGDTIQTDDSAALAEMMGTGALVYGIISQNRKMDIVFDWQKMLSFEGNSAPYLQYTYARARSVLRKAPVAEHGMFHQVIRALTDKERMLILMLLQFPDVLENTRETHMPHTLANYLFGLCQDFNAFYNSDPILNAAEPQQSLRLSLTAAVSHVLKTGAEILTLRVPERM